MTAAPRIFLLLFACLLIAAGPAPLCGQSWHSVIASPDGAGRLQYVRDANGNRIPDFSYAGYRNSEAPIPNVPVVKTIGPIAGDNTASIQAAIDEVGQMPLDASNFRGALLLNAGIYRVAGRINLNASGVVLRGAGDGPDSLTNTIIWATGDSASQSIVLLAGGGSETKWSNQVAGTKVNITSDTLLVGERTFTVESATPFAVGDNIILVHPCTDLWLQAVNYGDTRTDGPWGLNTLPIVYNRCITAISGDQITVDAPVFTTLIRSRAQSYVYTYARTGLRTNIGVEDLRIDIQAPGVTTDAVGNEHDHAWDAVWLRQIEDAWVRRCTALHFGQSGFKTSTASRITIDSCRALDPVSNITGERRYNFNTYYASQLILFRNISSTRARHDFVSNGTSSVSGIVFLDGSSDYAYNSSEGHRQWSQGMLYDNIVFRNPATTGYLLGLYSRGDYGTGHGWAAVHSVAWNCNAGARTIVIQQPPTAQNYAIGCIASSIVANAPFANPPGYIEGTNLAGLEPRSLFEAQLAERLGGSTRIGDEETGESIPATLRLFQNYPNPFNPETVIRYKVPVVSSQPSVVSSQSSVVSYQSSVVSLRVYDMLGREVATLFEGVQEPGWHHVVWNARGSASGVYVAVLRMNTEYNAKRMVLLR